MWLPKPVYESLPFLYLLVGLLVGVTFGLSPFSVISMASLFIGAGLIIYMRFTYRRALRRAKQEAASNAAASEVAPEASGGATES